MTKPRIIGYLILTRDPTDEDGVWRDDWDNVILDSPAAAFVEADEAKVRGFDAQVVRLTALGPTRIAVPKVVR